MSLLTYKEKASPQACTIKDLDTQPQKSAILTLATICKESNNFKLGFSPKHSENEFAFYFLPSHYLFRTTQDPAMDANMPTTLQRIRCYLIIKLQEALV